MRILVTGGAGFIGSHVAEYYAEQGNEVIVFDNLSRAKMMGSSEKNATYNWDYLKRYDDIGLIKGDVRDAEGVKKVATDVELIVHAAAQTAVTTSVIDPQTDLAVNLIGTFNVLEAARKASSSPTVIFCSTNKVYGENVNSIELKEEKIRYAFRERFKNGIPETFPIDLCEHTPYGCSKLAADLYMQDYARLYGLKTGVFRMSCIYGTRQFGVEDQGWVAHFAISTILEKPLTIYGDGKQVRDVLFVSDLVTAFDKFLNSDLKHGVFNIGGGPENTLSLLELLDILEELTGKRSEICFSNWRPSDQKVYISDVSKAKTGLGWQPEFNPKTGVKRLVDWIEESKELFKSEQRSLTNGAVVQK